MLDHPSRKVFIPPQQHPLVILTEILKGGSIHETVHNGLLVQPVVDVVGRQQSIALDRRRFDAVLPEKANYRPNCGEYSSPTGQMLQPKHLQLPIFHELVLVDGEVAQLLEHYDLVLRLLRGFRCEGMLDGAMFGFDRCLRFDLRLLWRCFCPRQEQCLIFFS